MQEVIVNPPADGEVVNPMSWFDSPGPFELEIGCGKGGFLLSRAKAAPHARLLGIEWANKYFKYCADRMVRWGISNVRVLRTDARHFVLHHLPPECVDILHLYHPDPWPKKRHHKRRLIQPDFVEAAARSLKPAALWLISSDHEAYFRWIGEVIGGCADLVEVPWSDVSLELCPDWAGTNYEIKYVREGRVVHRAAYRRA